MVNFDDISGMEDPFDFFGFDKFPNNPFEKNFKNKNFESKEEFFNLLESSFLGNALEKVESILARGVSLFPKDETVLKKSVEAAIKINRIDLAYKFSRELPPSVARAIIEYENGDFSGAIFSFWEIPPKMRIIYSLAYYNFLEREKQPQDFEIHLEILNPLAKDSAKANSILGILNFNEQGYFESEKYFEKARDLKKSEENYLNVFRAKYFLNKLKDIYSEMNQFFIDTNSKLTQGELERKIRDENIEPSKIRIKNLYSVVSKFLG